MTESPDYDRILQANLALVFGEGDRARRAQAIAEIYAQDAVLYEPAGEAKGQRAIGEAVESLLSTLPPDFRFRPTGPAVGHHGLGRLRWTGGAPGEPEAVTGTDVARIAEGKIQALYVFIDPAAA